MASTQATIDLVVRGSNAVNKLIQNVGQLQSAVDRINSQTLNLATPGLQRRANSLSATMQGASARANDLGRDRTQILSEQRQAIERLTQAQIRQQQAIERAASAERELSRLASRDELSSRRTDRLRGDLRQSAAEAERLGEEMNTASAAARMLESRLGAISNATRRSISSAGELINVNTTLAAANAVNALANQYNRYGDSLRRSSRESRLVGTVLPGQINNFNQFRNQIEQAEASLASLRAELRRLGAVEATIDIPVRPIGQGELLTPMSSAELERGQAAQQENRLREQRNARRTQLASEIAAQEAGLSALERRTETVGRNIARNQETAARLIANRDPANTTGLGISLNQIQAQAESLALVANNSQIASTSFNRFTVAAEMASIKLARAQQNTFTALAAGFSGGGGVNIPGGLRQEADIAGARNMVGQLISDIPNLTRSEGALNAHIQLLSQIRTILPFLSLEYRAVEEAIAGLNQELEGVGLRGQTSKIDPGAGQRLLKQREREDRTAQKTATAIDKTYQRQLDLLDKIDTLKLNTVEKDELRLKVERASDMLMASQLENAGALTAEIERQVKAKEKLFKAKPAQVFGIEGQQFMPVSGQMPSGGRIAGSPGARDAALRTQLGWQTALSQMEEISKQVKDVAIAKGAKVQMNWNLAFEKARDIVADATLAGLQDGTKAAVALGQQRSKEQERAVADAWKLSGGPAMPPWMQSNQKVFGALGTSFMPISGNMPKGRSQLQAEEAQKASREIAAQQIVVNKLQKQYTLEEGKGVQLLQEKVQLNGLLDMLAKGQVASTKANSAAIGQNIKYFRDMLALRVLEASAAGTYQGGGGKKATTAEQLEDRRGRLLERALGVQGTAIALEARGAQISQEKQEIEAIILRLKQLQGQASEDELKILLKQVQNLKTASQEISNALPPTQKGRTTDKTPFLEKLTGSPRASAAISEGLIGGAFPLLFGQGIGASAGGLVGGAAGGFAGGGLGFGLSLIGTALGSAVDEADRLDKELAKVNASVKGVGNTSADVNKLASSLGIAKEEAINLLAQFKQFGSAQIRKDLALVFGGGREAILESLESIVKEEDALQAIAAARKEIGNQEAISLLNTFKIQGSAQAQLVLREALLRISEKETIEEKKRITLLDRALAIAAGAAPAGAGIEASLVDPAIFGKRRAEAQQKAFEKEKNQRRKNYDTAIKESQKFFKKIDALSPSGEGSGKALGSNLLGAIDTRNEAIDNARKQREQQIADIRKQAVEVAARIEEDLADKRKQIEREIEDIRRRRADTAIDADIRFRELRGENPGLVEAERELLAISREDRDARTELQRRLGDEEREQARTIAEFEKGVAKQIQDANLASARAMGEIQSNYAKQVAKIVEEGSGKAGRRLAVAGELAAKYIERAALLQTRAGLLIDGQPLPTIPKPQAVGNELSYPGLRQDEVPGQFPVIDRRIIELERKLQSSRKPGIGQQFTALLGAESGFEDVAGLKPLPVKRMLDQAARPFQVLWKQIGDATNTWYEYGRREIKEILKPDPARSRQVLQRIQRAEAVRQNWDPLEAQAREQQNRMNPAPRSRPSTPSLSTFNDILHGMQRELLTKTLSHMSWSGGVIKGDLSEYLTENQLKVIRSGATDLIKKYGPELVERLVGGSFKAAIREAGELEKVKTAPRAGATSRPLDPAGGDQEWLQRFMKQTEPPQIVPGVQNRIEGASLPAEAFDVSKLATDFGTIAAASMLRGVLEAAGASGVPGGAQIAQSQRPYQVGDRVGYDRPHSQRVDAPSSVPRNQWAGAAATTQAREALGVETLAALDEQKFANLKNYFAAVGQEGVKINQNLIEQGRLLDLQVKYLNNGLEPSLARQLTILENTYSLNVATLKDRRETALQQGYNAEAVEQFYRAELDHLKEIYNQNTRLTREYEKQSEFRQSAAALRGQLAVTGAAEQAGFFGAGASAYTAELLRSGNAGQATELAQLTRALEVQQAVASIKGELNSLTDSANIAIEAADSINGAFGQAFQGLISGSVSAQEALSTFFSSVAESFLGMAAQIIAKQTTMIVLQSILKALGAVSGGGPGLSDLNAPATINNPLGDLGNIGGAYAKGGMFGSSITPFAMGGAFTNSIVSSPTLFRFADGGVKKTGEAGEAGPEAIMPLSRGPGGRLGVDASGLRSAMGPAPGVAGGSPVLNMSFETTTIGGVEYVSREQLESAMAETRRAAASDGAKRGMAMTLDTIQNSSSTRRRIGVK